MAAPRSQGGRPPRTLLYDRLRDAVAELRGMGGLPKPVEAEGIWDHIWAAEAHHSTAIEGNTLVLRQVEALLRENRAVGDKELREYLEVQGYAASARWIYDQALGNTQWRGPELLNLTEVRHVHHTALSLVWEVAPHPNATPDEAPGNFRRHDIQPFTRGMTPPAWTEVPALMTDWVDRVCHLPSESEPLIEAIASRHAEFEQIHPFLDGNGRVGRLLTNLVLVRLGFPPAVVYKRDRRRYLVALSKTDAGDPGPLGELFARAVLDNLYRFIIPAVAGPRRLVPLAALVEEALTLRGLRSAAERGRLRAVRGDDGQWRSSKAWVDEYRRSRYDRTAKPERIRLNAQQNPGPQAEDLDPPD